MLLREHPKLQPWPPNYDSFACPGPTPKITEIPALTLRSVRLRPPKRLVCEIDYAGGDCVWSRDFEDESFATALYELLKNSCGSSLQQIGNLELNF
jgi:hypothetical protein